MQHKISKGKLLDSNGNVIEAGYAFSLEKEYDIKDIKAKKSRIKEWDYYYIGNDDYGIALTMDDNAYMNMMSISVLNFKENKQVTKSYMHFFPKNRIAFPSTSKIGNISFKDKNCDMNFYNDGNERRLVCVMKNVNKNEDFSCDITLKEPNQDSMVIVTPFNKPKHFYYNQKINCLLASGSAKLGEKVYDLNGCYGVLDWGRGVWTYSNTWYWASMSGQYNGKRIGFNLGYGFGDTSAASENMFFYNDKAYKLNDITFNIKGDGTKQIDYLSDWTFTSKDNSIFMTFKPIMDRNADTDVIIIKSLQHQVFGYFSGYVMIEGEKVEFENMLGFAEKVKNCW